MRFKDTEYTQIGEKVKEILSEEIVISLPELTRRLNKCIKREELRLRAGLRVISSLKKRTVLKICRDEPHIEVKRSGGIILVYPFFLTKLKGGKLRVFSTTEIEKIVKTLSEPERALC